jgi:hypothetical protein
MGTLYYGDNLEILQRQLKDETVDLVYLDPPSNSSRNCNAFCREKEGADAARAGFCGHGMNKQKFPRLQLRTVKELMEGKGIELCASTATLDGTFKMAPESKKSPVSKQRWNYEAS